MSWASGTTVNTSTIWNYAFTKPAGYILRKNGSYFEAVNGVTGKLTYGGSGDAGGADGTNPYTVTDAAAAALTSGGLIYVRDADYRIAGADDITLQDNVYLVGESMDGVLFGSTGSSFIIRCNGTTDNVISNMKITSALDSNTPEIYVYGTTPNNVTVDHVHFSGTSTWAVCVASAETIRIRNCLCDSSTLQEFLYVSGTLTDGVVYNNTVKDTSALAIYVRGLKDSTIAYNRLEDAVGSNNSGMISIQNNNACANYSVSHNKIRFTTDPANTANGIVIGGEAGSTYYNEQATIDGNKIIVDSTVTSNVNVGIYFHGYNSGNHMVRNIACSNNVIYGDGFLNYGIADSMADKCNVFGNIVDTTQINGILVADSDYVQIKGNQIYSWNQAAGGDWAIDLTSSPTHVVGDGVAKSYAPMDLSGAAGNHYVFHPEQNAVLLNAYFVYSEASSADAGITLKLGKESDDDYYYTGTSEQSKSQWYTATLTLLQRDVAAGDTVIFNSAGSKAGTGEILCVVDYCLID